MIHVTVLWALHMKRRKHEENPDISEGPGRHQANSLPSDLRNSPTLENPYALPFDTHNQEGFVTSNDLSVSPVTPSSSIQYDLEPVNRQARLSSLDVEAKYHFRSGLHNEASFCSGYEFADPYQPVSPRLGENHHHSLTNIPQAQQTQDWRVPYRTSSAQYLARRLSDMEWEDNVGMPPVVQRTQSLPKQERVYDYRYAQAHKLRRELLQRSSKVQPVSTDDDDDFNPYAEPKFVAKKQGHFLHSGKFSPADKEEELDDLFVYPDSQPAPEDYLGQDHRYPYDEEEEEEEEEEELNGYAAISRAEQLRKDFSARAKLFPSDYDEDSDDLRLYARPQQNLRQTCNRVEVKNTATGHHGNPGINLMYTEPTEGDYIPAYAQTNSIGRLRQARSDTAPRFDDQQYDDASAYASLRLSRIKQDRMLSRSAESSPVMARRGEERSAVYAHVNKKRRLWAESHGKQPRLDSKGTDSEVPYAQPIKKPARALSGEVPRLEIDDSEVRYAKPMKKTPRSMPGARPRLLRQEQVESDDSMHDALGYAQVKKRPHSHARKTTLSVPTERFGSAVHAAPALDATHLYAKVNKTPKQFDKPKLFSELEDVPGSVVGSLQTDV